MEGNPVPLDKVKRIPVTDLKSGMTVMKEGRGGFIPDVHLGKYFRTSERFPTISFNQEGGGAIVIWRKSGYAWILADNLLRHLL